jgi:hypothetical protein
MATKKTSRKKRTHLQVKGPANMHKIQQELVAKLKVGETELFEHGDEIVIQIDGITHKSQKPRK